MSHIVRSVAALRDASDIWDYIGLDDPAAASRLIKRIDDKLLFLSDNRLAGTPRPEMGRDVRSFVVGRYLILYRPIAGGIRLVRILNGARDLPRARRRS